ncbi:MAG: carboxypeptidase-like regulatory domain-containing protein, partial [Bryobacteraceae bacterium]
MRQTLICAVLGLALALGPPPAPAQVLYGSLVGTVTDPSGAVVPRATITITNTATGLTREAVGDEGGRFALLNVPAGIYELKAGGPGFRPYSRPGVAISINTV